jgi:hypothetical protein
MNIKVVCIHLSLDLVMFLWRVHHCAIDIRSLPIALRLTVLIIFHEWRDADEGNSSPQLAEPLLIDGLLRPAVQ